MSDRFKKAKNKQKVKIILCIMTVLIGLFVLIHACFQIVDHHNKKKTYIEATGVVVDYDYSDDEESNAIYLIVEYEVKRQKYQIISPSGSNHPKDIGSYVTIMFNPEDPNDAIFKLDDTNISLPIMGVLFIVAGIFATLQQQRVLKKQFIDVENERLEGEENGKHYING